MRFRRSAGAAALSLLAAAGEAIAQERGPAAVAASVPGWIGLTAAPARERGATETIAASSAGWTRGPLGALVKRAGSGSPRRLIGCYLDAPAYTVSEIRRDGFVRVHSPEPVARHALWDQFHEGQRVLVHTRRGAVPGVFAVRSNHLWRGRPQATTIVTTDDLWLDVGARDSAEAAGLGISVLDAVAREWPAWRYGEGAESAIAGPHAEERTRCAIVAALAAAGAPATGENVYVIATQTAYGLPRPFDPFLGEIGPVTESWRPGLDVLAAAAPHERVRGPASSLGARARGSLVESVRLVAIANAAEAAARRAGIDPAALRPVVLPPPAAAPPMAATRGSHDAIGALLARYSDLYAPGFREASVREAVLADLPAWARALARTDSAGNLVLAIGAERDTTVLIAHMDEIGFEVRSIARDGTVSLTPRGSFYNSLYEGQPALVHVGSQAPDGRSDGACGAAANGPLRGIFLPRDSATTKQPSAMTAWFGLDSAALAARGVVAGSSLTGYKCAARLAGTRFTARSVDDRAGVIAMLLAVRRLDPARLARRVIFVWSVREEGGLAGAGAASALFGPSVRTVHPIDTFVSSDSPIESSRFGMAVLGGGAVVRALDNSSATDPDEVKRVVELARARGIPLRVGVTNGGNDGSRFVERGAQNVPLAWPLRYSHSPAEVSDLRDVQALADLVHAVATRR